MRQRQRRLSWSQFTWTSGIAQTLYEVPGDTSAMLARFYVFNGGTPGTLFVAVNASDGPLAGSNATLRSWVLAAGDLIDEDLWLVLRAGDKFQTFGATGQVANLMLMGYESAA